MKPSKRSKGRPGGGQVRIARTLLDRLPKNLDAPSVCRGLRVNRRTLYNWCALPENPLPHKRDGEHYSFEKNTLVEWLVATKRTKAQTEYEK